MSEPIITCPHCHTDIKLTESLAAPLVAATRKLYETQLAQKDTAIANREHSLREQEMRLQAKLQEQDQHIAQQVAQQLAAQKTQLIAQAAQKAQADAANELATKSRELQELGELLKSRDAKLQQAQAAQAEVLKQARELDDAKRELELTIEQKVTQGLQEVRQKATREAEDSLRLKLAEKDHTIAAMQQKVEELKQKAEQGSQQLQGEVQELELENLLRSRFAYDLIEPVPKGEFGGDAVQRVRSPNGTDCGSILWESKRTKHWSDAWLTKLRDDQRSAKAEVCVLVSQVLPKGVETFELIDGVWVTHPKALLPVATMLRLGLLQVSQTRALSQGQHTKTEMVYQYLTGPRFKQRIEAIVEAFSTMQEDLDKERKAIEKQWAKRAAQIERVMGATVGMYGDLQGIAGKSLQEIEGLEFKLLGE